MIDYDAMEAVLLANWHRFIDTKRLMAVVLASTRDTKLHIVPHGPDGKQNRCGVRISLSRIRPTEGGLSIWADFSVDRPGGMGHGTAQLAAGADGRIEFVGLAG